MFTHFQLIDNRFIFLKGYFIEERKHKDKSRTEQEKTK